MDPALPSLGESITEALLVLESGGTPRVANAWFRQLAQDGGTELGEGGWLRVIAPQDRAQAQALWLEAAERLAPREAMLGLLSGGRVLCRMAPVKETGGILGWVVTLTDTGPEEERAALRLALARSEDRQREEAALRMAAEERLSMAEDRLQELDGRRRAEREEADERWRAAETRAAQAEAALMESTSRLADAEGRLRTKAAALAMAEARLAAAVAGQDTQQASQPEEDRPEEHPAESPAMRPLSGALARIDEQCPPISTEGGAEECRGAPLSASEKPAVQGPSPFPLPTAGRAPGSEDDHIDRVLGRLRSETLRVLLADWREIRRDGVAPLPHAWEPDLPDGSVDVRAAEIGDGGAPVRIAAIGVQAADPLGRVLAGSGPSDAAWRRCAGTALPVHEFAQVTLGHGGPRTHERLLLPFSSDGRQVDHVLSLAVASDAPSLHKVGTEGA